MDNLEFRKFLNGYGLTYEQYEVLPEEQKLELEKRFRVQSKSEKTDVIGEGLKGVGCILILIPIAIALVGIIWSIIAG